MDKLVECRCFQQIRRKAHDPEAPFQLASLINWPTMDGQSRVGPIGKKQSERVCQLGPVCNGRRNESWRVCSSERFGWPHFSPHSFGRNSGEPNLPNKQWSASLRVARRRRLKSANNGPRQPRRTKLCGSGVETWKLASPTWIRAPPFEFLREAPHFGQWGKLARPAA